MNILIAAIPSLLIILFIYAVYQIFRNEEVYKIQMRWVRKGLYSKLYDYPYDYMFKPNKHNWIGLKWPREKDYK